MAVDTRKIELTFDEYVKILRFIENIRVSLDQIGRIGAYPIYPPDKEPSEEIKQRKRQKMREAIDEYLSGEEFNIYGQIKDISWILANKVSREEELKAVEGIKYFEPQDYHFKLD